MCLRGLWFSPMNVGLARPVPLEPQRQCKVHEGSRSNLKYALKPLSANINHGEIEAAFFGVGPAIGGLLPPYDIGTVNPYNGRP